ncbi:FKBP-type peptidyl-prolyl cis-trans isomerase [uncultured Bifidobacterium sp.]|uniref:FKBP-type peptidyl-prolyl cis-trans isomerase n=1 Tax=uncultured Bifidobacterium sp. TaxID=165187 RepID=UPI002595087A|nr:FKBP-type peptidyl-prolyl cis-trans isomerase [uncultured Bifidobacterium sp.]
MQNKTSTSLTARLMAVLCALAMCATLTACGGGNGADDTGDSSNANDSAQSSSDALKDLPQIAGLLAEGEPGQKPTVKFHAPMSVEDGAYAVLQKGNGDQVEVGNRVCMQGIAVNLNDGSEMASTWEDDTPDCSALVTEEAISQSPLYALIAEQKINATFAIGSNDGETPYVWVMTIISQSTDPTRAEGEAVTDIPADLPKVTLDKDGKPSIDMNGQGDVDELVVQTLIKGDGKEVKEGSYVRAHYTGWLLDGTQFDSSWDRGEPSDFSLTQVIEGWSQGLAGQTVGSQVLLIVPSDLGYGDSGSGDTIPGGATLVFVVDILATY